MNISFLNLTNANPLNRGMPISIRKDLVITVHANHTVREDASVELVTYVFAPPHGTWEVIESYDTVMQQLREE
jgi:hypothetical protein